MVLKVENVSSGASFPPVTSGLLEVTYFPRRNLNFTFIEAVAGSVLEEGEHR